MTIRRLAWRSFRIPFRAPFATALGEMRWREGIIVRLEADDGLVGLGEASPLFEWGDGTAADVDRLLRELTPLWLRRLSPEGKDPGPDRGEWGDAWAPGGPNTRSEPSEGVPEERSASGYPRSHRGAVALLCALDTARLDLLARLRGVRVADILAGGAPSSVAGVVAVNAVVGVDDPLVAAEAAALAARRGFTCVKLKVGMLGSPGAEASRVGRVREALGSGVALRLDANGAWSAARAIETICACEPFGIEVVEQPVPAGEIDELALVSRTVDTTVAADEAMRDPDLARRIVEQRASDAIVLKPMVLGGSASALALAEAARRSDMGVLITSAFEAGVGIAAALHLAAALQPLPACGLATAQLLEGDLLRDSLAVSGGVMRLPAAPGLGVALDEDQMRRFAGAYRGEVSLDDASR